MSPYPHSALAQPKIFLNSKKAYIFNFPKFFFALLFLQGQQKQVKVGWDNFILRLLVDMGLDFPQCLINILPPLTLMFANSE